MKKKILIISKDFYPVNSPRSFRTTELVKEFASEGHNVTLLIPTKEKNHDEFEKEYGVKILDFKGGTYRNFNLSKGSKLILLLKRVINRLLQILFEYPDIELFLKLKAGLRGHKNYDLLISIATPHQIHWGIARAWNVNKPIAKCWIADCGDPFMGSTLETFNKMFYFKYIEKWWCRKANFITIPFEGARNAYYSEFHEKIKVIPQGFNFKDSVIDDNETYKENVVPTFAYAGSFIPENRDPRAFIEYLIKSKKDFKFVIFTRNRNLIESYLEEAKGKIEIKNYLERKELLKFLSTMDFLLNINNSISTQLPSKLIDYCILKKPILSIDSKGFDEKVVDQFLKGDYTNQLLIENVEDYRIENVCKNFLNLSELN